MNPRCTCGHPWSAHEPGRGCVGRVGLEARPSLGIEITGPCGCTGFEFRRQVSVKEAKEKARSPLRAWKQPINVAPLTAGVCKLCGEALPPVRQVAEGMAASFHVCKEPAA